MDSLLQILSIIISVILILVILFQVKGGLGSSLLGSSESAGGVARTRRGLEKTLFQITIVLSVTFLVVSILAVSLTRS